MGLAPCDISHIVCGMPVPQPSAPPNRTLLREHAFHALRAAIVDHLKAGRHWRIRFGRFPL